MLAIREDERQAILEVALDYAHGAYTVDGARMERALHPHLAKRAVFTENGKSRLHQMTALELVQYARNGYGQQPADHRQSDVQILEVYGNVAMVRLEMNDWVDFMQLAKVDGNWKIINILWELNPQES